MTDPLSRAGDAPGRVPGWASAARSPALPREAEQRLHAVLRAAVARYYAGQRAPDADLEEVVCAVVDALRAQGLAVTAVLPALRTLVADGGATPQHLVDDAVRWCIARYYAHGPARDADCDVDGDAATRSSAGE